jgi:hypothetical protein
MDPTVENQGPCVAQSVSSPDSDLNWTESKAIDAKLGLTAVLELVIAMRERAASKLAAAAEASSTATDRGAS